MAAVRLAGARLHSVVHSFLRTLLIFYHTTVADAVALLSVVVWYCCHSLHRADNGHTVCLPYAYCMGTLIGRPIGGLGEEFIRCTDLQHTMTPKANTNKRHRLSITSSALTVSTLNAAADSAPPRNALLTVRKCHCPFFYHCIRSTFILFYLFTNFIFLMFFHIHASTQSDPLPCWEALRLYMHPYCITHPRH